MLRLSILIPAFVFFLNALAQAPSTSTPGATGALFEASAAAVRPGDSVALRWDWKGGAKVRLDPGGLVMEAKGHVTVKPAATTIYTLTEVKSGGAVLGRLEIRIEPYAPYGEPAKVCEFEASTHAVLPGEPVKLSWTCTGTAKVKMEPGGLELDGQSEITVTPLETTRYTITASNFAGGASRTVEVQVLKSPVGAPARVCAFTAERTAVRPGEPVELRWECVGDSKVRLEPGGIELDGKDHITVQPSETTVYTLSAANLLGGSSRSLEIRVIAGLPISIAPIPSSQSKQSAQPVVEIQAQSKPEAAASVPTPVPTSVPTAVETKLASNAKVTGDTKLAAFRESNLPLAIALSEAQRAATPPERWTVRLVVSGSLEGLKVLARPGGKEVEDLMVLPFVRRDGIRWWQACYGAFSSKSAALSAYAKLPEALKKALSAPLPLHIGKLPGDLPKS